MRTLSLFCLILFVLGGCGRIPEPVGYEHTIQQKMQAAHHWDVLAQDVASQINNQLIISDYLNTPVYVKATCGDEDTPCTPNQTSAFNEAFRDLLITEMVNFGVPTRSVPNDDTITVNYKVQVVQHNTRRIRTLQPGLITSLTTAVMVFRNVPDEILTIAASGLVDYANQSLVVQGQFEVIITSSMVMRDQYLFRTSDIYYINDADFYHYQENLPQVAEIPLITPPVVVPVEELSPAADSDTNAQNAEETAPEEQTDI